jgi:hypothetical protein
MYKYMYFLLRVLYVNTDLQILTNVKIWSTLDSGILLLVHKSFLESNPQWTLMTVVLPAGWSGEGHGEQAGGKHGQEQQIINAIFTTKTIS